MGTTAQLKISTPYRRNRKAKWGLDYRSPWDLDQQGRRRRIKRFFEKKQDRDDALDGILERYAKYGESAGPQLSPAEVEDYRAARSMLPQDVSIREAARHYCEHHKAAGGPLLTQVFADYVKVLRSRGLDRKWIKGVEATLGRFASSLPHVATVQDPNPQQIRHWLAGLKGRNKGGYSDVTLHGFRRHLHGAFEWATTTEHLRDHNPVAAVAAPKVHRKAPVFYSVEETRAILAAAVRTDPGFVPIITLRCFAGIRGAEVKRMLPGDIHAKQRAIDLPGFRDVAGRPQRVTKSGKRRIIEDAPPVLWEWLTRYPLVAAKRRAKKFKGQVAQTENAINYTKRFRAIISAANVPMKQNAFRHNFATYHVALKKSANLTILILGQEEDSKVFYSHYRNPSVTREMAKRYFALSPKSVLSAGDVVVEALPLAREAAA